MTQSAWSRQKKHIRIQGHDLAYIERGTGRPMVFLHGNPTSSFLWRDVLAPLAERARCIAPDLLGMGDSDKLVASGPDSYGFEQHRRFLEGFLDAVVPDEPIILVVHDWGSALGFDWARRNPTRVRAIAYMEAIAGPLRWDAWEPGPRAVFERLRSPEGERLILEENMFVEKILPASILRKLSEAELDEYRRPFRAPGESRRPTLAFPRMLPLDGSPPDIVEIVKAYAEFLAGSEIPKLFVNAEPGRVLTGELREACRRWPNQEEVTVRGLHFLQEDSGPEIAQAIAAWASRLSA
ncbi:MAG: haloalkane dehalogenase [Polyangiaceae bacterium]|nr:haloalkane dehalogenase [Polyangiaceae bacterium]